MIDESITQNEEPQEQPTECLCLNHYLQKEIVNTLDAESVPEADLVYSIAMSNPSLEFSAKDFIFAVTHLARTGTIQQRDDEWALV
jgi:hypothetical protein